MDTGEYGLWVFLRVLYGFNDNGPVTVHDNFPSSEAYPQAFD